MLYLPQPEQTSAYPQLELIPKVLNVLFKWKWLILACILAVTAPVAVVTHLKPPQYQIAMKVLVKSSRAQMAVNFSGAERAGASSPLVTWPVTPQVLNSEIQILKSQDLLTAAVAQSGYPLLGEGQEDSPVSRERALLALRTRLSFTPVPESNVIEVSLQDGSAENAARLLNTLAALYLRKHASVHAGGDHTADFFAQQARLQRERLETARQALEAFQERDNIVDIKAEMDNNLSKLNAMESQLKEMTAEIEGTRKEIALLEQQIRDLPEEITKERTVVANPEVGMLRTKLLDLERQRDELLGRYTPKSRFVMDKEAEIAAVRKSLEGREPNVAGDTIVAQNRIKEALVQQLFQKQAGLDALVGRQQAIRRERTSYEARLNVLKDRTFGLAAVRSEYDLARDAYQMYEKRAEEARVSKAMDDEKIVHASIVQEASKPMIPLPRGLAMAGAVSGVAGIVLGVVLAFGLEFFNVTIQDEKDVERFLQVPVLATVKQF
jgi:uncharacterized protein involved in exopolysaccharide biosynthesis